uniref:Potassium inwardly rectifying channel subfamily J member 10 n=1 Tax=Fundulus heteroclitus TaxID=8078 RepID=A0A3Q2NWA3_FUNHE
MTSASPPSSRSSSPHKVCHSQTQTDVLKPLLGGSSSAGSGTLRKRRRILTKDGRSNMRIEHVSGRNALYMRDLWTTFLEMPWRYKFFLFTATFAGTWFVFGVVWYLLALVHGDLLGKKAEVLTEKYLLTVSHSPPYPPDHPQISSSISIPSETKVLIRTDISNYVVLCERTSMSVDCGRKPEYLKKTQNSLRSVLVLPLSSFPFLCCLFKITLIFPLSGGGWTDPEMADFELLVILSATIEPTSATCQVRTSYLPDEILWGYEFPPVVSLSKSGKYVADFSFFDKVAKTMTTPIFKPSSSQREYQSNGGGLVSEGTDPEKIRLEQSYREQRGEDRGRVRDGPLSVRISNV